MAYCSATNKDKFYNLPTIAKDNWISKANKLELGHSLTHTHAHTGTEEKEEPPGEKNCMS